MLTAICRPAETSERAQESRWTNLQVRGLVMVLLIAGVWILVAFLINPRGEFPLIDDWAYAGSVKKLLGGEGLKISGWGQSNLVAQILWGAFFCLPFGFSFAALRISTLTLGVTGVLALYGLLREADVDRETALFGALLLAFNPLYLVLSYTFMSDVPFTAVSILSFYFLVRGMRRNSRLEVAAGLFLACAALLIRQPGLAIFMAFGLTYLAKSGLRPRSMFLAGIPVAFGGVVEVLWHQRMIFPATYAYSNRVGFILSPRSYLSWQTAVPLARGFIILSMYLGLFLIPILLFVGRKRMVELGRSRLLNLATLAFAVLAAYLMRYRRMPLVGDVLYNLGLGPILLRDGWLPSHPTAGRSFWWVVTLLGFGGAVVLVKAALLAISKALKFLPLSAGKRDPLVMLLAGGLIYLVPLAILTAFGQIFDRYVLLLVPVGIAVFVILVSDLDPGKAGSPIMPLAVATLVLYGAFSIAGTHDYLSWNRARWQALNNLATEQRVLADDIDGGFEFNGWYLYDPEYRAIPEKSWWWVAGDDFIVTLRPVPGYTELRRYPFRRWLPPGAGNILVLERMTQAH